jgi:serine/threonine protein kinase
LVFLRKTWKYKKTARTFGVDTTLPYIAPEVLKNKTTILKVDSWALGIILYELLSPGTYPFSKDGKDKTMKSIIE